MEATTTGRRNIVSISAFALILLAVGLRILLPELSLFVLMGGQVLAIMLGVLGLLIGGRDSEFGLVAIVTAVGASLFWFWTM